MVSRKATELSNQPLWQSTCRRTLSIRRHPQPGEPTSKALRKSKNGCTSKQKRRVPAIPEPSAPPLASAALGSVIDISTDKADREDGEDKEDKEDKLGNDDDIDEEEQPELLRFMSTWKAVVDKESLPVSERISTRLEIL
jgi:hypothetical protein